MQYDDILRSSIVLAPTFFDKFKTENQEDYIDLLREFETKKRSIQAEKTGKETIKMPFCLTSMYEKETKKKISDRIAELKQFEGKVMFTNGKCRIDADIVKSWFDDSCKNMIRHVEKLFKDSRSKDCNTILLVGGFSESPMLQHALKTNFSDKRMIIPEEAGLVVLKGAVLYGHNPLTIVSRVAKCSYGIRVFRDFVEGKHPESKKVKVGKKFKCKDVFAKHVTKGQELVIGVAQSKERYIPLEADQISLVFDVYTSTEDEPLFITDEMSTHIGQLEVEVPDTTDGRNRGVIVSMIFGGTEVSVEGTVEKTGAVTKASFDFLQ